MNLSLDYSGTYNKEKNQLRSKLVKTTQEQERISYLCIVGSFELKSSLNRFKTSSSGFPRYLAMYPKSTLSGVDDESIILNLPRSSGVHVDSGAIEDLK